jgi:hypothetical protein
MDYLDSAGFVTPKHGTASRLLSESKHKNFYLYETMDELMLFITDINGSAKLISLKSAHKLDPETYIRDHIPANPTNHGLVIKYVRIGNLCMWFYIRSNNPLVSESNANHIEIVNNAPIKLEKQPNINLPLYSIDFIMTELGPIAINLSATPDLGALGVNKILSPKQVAQAIQDQILNPLSPDEC